VAWSPDGKTIAETSGSGTRFYDPKLGKILPTLTIAQPAPAAAPLPPSWSPNGKAFVSGSLVRVELRDPPTSKSPHVLSPLSPGPVAYTWAADGRTVAFAQGGDVRWFIGEARQIRGVVSSPGTDQAVFVQAMGHYRIASGNENDMVYVAQSAGEQQTMMQQTLTPAEFAKAYGWKNDVRWVRVADR
jgi:WD40 repeat protein